MARLSEIRFGAQKPAPQGRPSHASQLLAPLLGNAGAAVSRRPAPPQCDLLQSCPPSGSGKRFLVKV